MYTNLVLSGGAFKGIALLGALKYLEELDYISYIKNYTGSSAGGIICFFIILGYKPYEIKEMLLNEINNITDLDFNNISNFLYDYGIDNCENNKKILSKYLKQKTDLEDITFIEFTKKFGTNLTLTGSNLTKHTLDYFNIDNTPNMSIIQAVLITSCIPFIFKPIEYNDCLYVDGGIYNNFAIDQYKKNKNETLGINIKSNIIIKNDNFINYCNNIIYSIIDKLTYDNIKKNNYNIINITFDYHQIDDIKFSFKDLNIEVKDSVINKYYDFGYNEFKKLFKVDF
tara:strand:+ start:20 stop:871 length:852 start_codon:yes stop_codon:yes gene_type:complete